MFNKCLDLAKRISLCLFIVSIFSCAKTSIFDYQLDELVRVKGEIEIDGTNKMRISGVSYSLQRKMRGKGDFLICPYSALLAGFNEGTKYLIVFKVSQVASDSSKIERCFEIVSI